MAKGKKQSAKGPAESQVANMNKTTAARSDWRKANMTREQQKHCATIIKAMKQYRNAGPFLDPVDPVKLGIPDYLKIIQHPMDIGTLERKLDNCEYESVSAFADDARLIFNNCYIYNGKDAVISKAAQELEEIFERMMAKMPGQPVAKPAEPSTSKPPKPTEISISKVSEPKRPKREIRPPPPKDYPETPSVRKGSVSKKRDAEMKFLRAIIREFKKKQHAPYAYPFYEPVDAMKLGVPDYYDVIKNPMDISTLNNKLENGQYESADEFEKDVRLMFRNCYAYNPPGSDVYNMGKQLEAVFDRKWKEKPEPMPRDPSPETRDDTSSSDDGPTRKNSMKGSKDSTSNKKAMAKRARGKADEEDFEPLTVEQKNELGERINRLSEDKTNELIALISASGAHLEAEDGSYELEIESVDDRTARRIYDFVVAHTPKPRQPPAKKPRTHYSEEEQQRKITALEQQLQKFDGKMNGSSGKYPILFLYCFQ
ncbi:4936_t:CDS:2 [Paraglomus occultum]|uniref:4936_t:CDS:1 n=1 Tax=Paraglomus occultum TaxID=144539 RepID=A0A9N8VTX0_9GLOM|nr:4936_t:CDS:2 [Paraglomus occultum]